MATASCNKSYNTIWIHENINLTTCVSNDAVIIMHTVVAGSKQPFANFTNCISFNHLQTLFNLLTQHTIPLNPSFFLSRPHHQGHGSTKNHCSLSPWSLGCLWYYFYSPSMLLVWFKWHCSLLDQLVYLISCFCHKIHFHFILFF